MTARDYDGIADALASVPPRGRDEAMRLVADALWDGLAATGVSWVGFYFHQPDQPDDRCLVLGPHRDGPACSPIGRHGVCGQAVASGATRIVDDVAALGDAYVACDPRDRSEIVIPLLDGDDGVWGVLDVDSRDVASFGAADADGLARVLGAAGLRTRAAGGSGPAASIS